jgi:hypothetical protein
MPAGWYIPLPARRFEQAYISSIASAPRTTFTFKSKGLKTSIQSLLPIPVDLQWYDGPIETPAVHAGLEESSVLIYKAD